MYWGGSSHEGEHSSGFTALTLWLEIFSQARITDFIPEKWKSGDIEIACGNVENPGKFG